MKKSILPVLVVLLVVLQGCEAAKNYVGLGDGPQLSTLVGSITSVPVTGTAVTINGVPQYRCVFPLTLTVSGGISGDVIGWEGGTLDATLKANGTTKTTTLIYADYTTIFGSYSIPKGASPIQGSYTVSWLGQFTATLTTRYGASNAGAKSLSVDRSTTTNLTCN